MSIKHVFCCNISLFCCQVLGKQLSIIVKNLMDALEKWIRKVLMKLKSVYNSSIEFNAYWTGFILFYNGFVDVYSVDHKRTFCYIADAIEMRLVSDEVLKPR